MKLTRFKVSLQQTCCALGISTALLAPFGYATEGDPVLQALFDQAAYWHDRAHDDLAQNALNKILSVDAKNREALYLMSLYAVKRGDSATATRWKTALQTIAPDDPRLQALEGAAAEKNIPQAQLAQARGYAAKGETAQAIAAYQAIFQKQKPVGSLATEYYSVLASSPTGREAAITGLKQQLALSPNDDHSRLALAKILTYQEASRREGINLLSSMAVNNRDADQALKQALLWLAPEPADKPLYDAYQARHPTDKTLSDYFQKNSSGSIKGSGFSELNSGDLSGASDQFSRVLAINPNDGDALAGLGFIAMRRGDFSRAENYLTQAAQQGGANSTQWTKLAKEANFYGQLDKAKKAVIAGKLDEAMALSEPLISATGDQGNAIALFRADVLKRKGDADGAEKLYRDLLAQNSENNEAKLGLYYLLQSGKNRSGAAQLLQTIPANLRPHINQGVPAVNVEPLRREAEQAAQQNDAQRALHLLQQAQTKQANNPWVKLDMARILQKQGNEAQAEALISPLARLNASADELHAAALFASSNNHWSNASALLARIPAKQQSKEMRELMARAAFNQQRINAEQYLQQGNNPAAMSILHTLAASPPANPVDVGQLAKDLAAAGDTGTAVQLVRDSIRSGVKGKPGEYAGHIEVLNNAGLSVEADTWLNNAELRAKGTPAEIKQLRMGSLINEADQLRLRGQYAPAYDKLMNALQDDPQNSDLILAMGRLYQSGKMDKEAGQVFNYLLIRDSQNKDAREGAINVALAEGNVTQAKQLLQGLNGTKNADQLLLAARVAVADGDNQQALILLNSAKSRLTGGITTSTMPSSQRADNPFARQMQTPTKSEPVYGEVLPWQRPTQMGGESAANSLLTSNSTQQQIDQMINEIREKTATWAQGAVSVRNNSSGEPGLSNVTVVKAPISLSAVPAGNARISVDVTPVMINAGTPQGTASNRFGTGALQQAYTVQGATQASAAAAAASVSAAETAAATARQAELDYQQIHATRDQICSVSPTSAECRTLAVSDANAYEAKQQADSAANIATGKIQTARIYTPKDFNAPDAESQKGDGVELNLALSGDSYKLDIGSTPLGQVYKSVVGGLQWSPRLTKNSNLRLVVERRAVADSLLSYVGTKDPFTGESWGAVTKNGAGFTLSYDDGYAGAYLGGGYYSYIGRNVNNNHATNGLLGAYIRPYADKQSELKVGVSANYMNFEKNLSYFSLGQGGYFSPQNYFSVSLPVEYSHKEDEFGYKLGFSVGYQSYTNKESLYFPHNPELQNQLQQLVNQGYGKEANYEAQSKHGINYNVNIEGNYKISPNMLVGGQVGYDTFGSYKETTGQLYLKYALDGK